MPRYSIRDVIRIAVTIVLLIVVITAITLGTVQITQVAAEEIRKRRRFKAKSGNERIEVLLSEDEQMISYSIILKDVPIGKQSIGMFMIDDQMVHALRPLKADSDGQVHYQGIWRQPTPEVIAAMREGRLRADIWFDGRQTKLSVV